MHRVNDSFTSFTRTFLTTNPDPPLGPNTNILCHPDSNDCIDAYRDQGLIRFRRYMKRGGCSSCG